MEPATIHAELDPERPTPPRLYKYKPLNDATSRTRLHEIIVNSKLYFPSRTAFNDPFDCLVPSFDRVNKRSLRKFIQKRLKKMGVPNYRAMAKKINLLRLQQDIQKDVDKAGILSLTERPDNLLMWAHYSSSHTGVCLEFEVSTHELFFGRAQPVIYSNTRPKFNPRGTEEENVEGALLTKSIEWAYEREWRIIDHLVGVANFPFDSSLLKGIIFGARVSDSDRTQIKEWVSNGRMKIDFYQAELHESTGTITAKKIL